MGGPATCTVVFTGSTAEEIVKSAMDHVTQAHPDMAEQIKKMTPEETAKWMADFHTQYDALPEM